MRRIAIPVRRPVFLGVAVLAALLLTLPLRLALGALGLPEDGLTARAAEGSVWSGRLVEARISGVPLGDLDVGLHPLPLLAGRARLGFARPGARADEAGDGDGATHGRVTVSRHILGLDGATLRLPVARLLAPLPVRVLALGDASARFRDGVCEAADGLVRAELAGAIGGVTLPGGFSGTARCDAGALLLPLASQSGEERLALRLLGAGRYRIAVTLRPADAAAQARLTAAGFVKAPDGAMTLGIDGSW